MGMQKNNYAVVLQGFVPIRKEPHERAEMISQVLFGEFVEVLDDEGNWRYIRLINDLYEGWADSKCLIVTEKAEKSAYIVSQNNISLIHKNGFGSVIVPIGSSIPELRNNEFELAKQVFKIAENAQLTAPGKKLSEEVMNSLVSIPYLWGGRCGFGFDCSGLIQYLCRLAGVELPRDSSDQATMGATLSFINEAELGDLAFFDDAEGRIHHVGMILENKRIIHASGKVRIDKIDQQGVFNEELGRYTHKLRVLKRVLGT
jgi:hypothetical protein